MESFEKLIKIYDTNKTLLGSGHLLNQNSGTIKVKGINLPIIDANTEIYIEVYDEFKGILPFYCSVIVAASNQLNARILRVEPRHERRSSLKVRTKLSLYIEKLERNNDDITSEVPNMKINLLNLSIGGMLITSNYELKLEDVITFRFQYEKNQIILLKAKVIRIDKVYDPITPDYYNLNYGCMFEKLSSFDETVLTKYLYDRQIQLYKNR
jgi:c-di-GMP-binding flagellar brake protein YcgR